MRGSVSGSSERCSSYSQCQEQREGLLSLDIVHGLGEGTRCHMLCVLQWEGLSLASSQYSLPLLPTWRGMLWLSQLS